MSATALVLVLTAALFHATWNLIIKRRSSGGAAFLWLACALSSLIYAPVAVGLILVQQPRLEPLDALFILVSAAVHVAYFLTLQRGYRMGDLSLVYPLARGTGPMLATVFAIYLFGERPTALALVGAALIGAGVFYLSGGLRVLRDTSARRAAAYGILTGILIAFYTLWDAYAVSTLLIPPLLFDWCANLGRMLFLLPAALHRRERVWTEWRTHRFEVLGVAVLSPLAYILTLTALVFTPISYVAPTREISILIGTAFGTRLLAEGDGLRRGIAAGAILLGVTALAVG